MAYEFSNQILGKVLITDEQGNEFTLTKINTQSNDANILMGGLSYMLDIVGWSVQNATRVVNQDVVEGE